MNILQKLYPQNDEKMIEVKLDKEHFPFKLLAHKTTVEDFIQGKIINPIHCRIGLTNKCNLRCKFCNFHKKNEKDFYDEFSFEVIHHFYYEYHIQKHKHKSQMEF